MDKPEWRREKKDAVMPSTSLQLHTREPTHFTLCLIHSCILCLQINKVHDTQLSSKRLEDTRRALHKCSATKQKKRVANENNVASKQAQNESKQRNCENAILILQTTMHTKETTRKSKVRETTRSRCNNRQQTEEVVMVLLLQPHLRLRQSKMMQRAVGTQRLLPLD